VSVTTTTLCGVFVDVTQQLQMLQFALAKTDVTCNGGSDGTITATPHLPETHNDNPVYTYTLNGITVGGVVAVTRPSLKTHNYLVV
jgi:hypothetical protein